MLYKLQLSVPKQDPNDWKIKTKIPPPANAVDLHEVSDTPEKTVYEMVISAETSFVALSKMEQIARDRGIIE